jgi:hypothetical protein
MMMMIGRCGFLRTNNGERAVGGWSLLELASFYWWSLYMTLVVVPVVWQQQQQPIQAFVLVVSNPSFPKNNHHVHVFDPHWMKSPDHRGVVVDGISRIPMTSTPSSSSSLSFYKYGRKRLLSTNRDNSNDGTSNDDDDNDDDDGAKLAAAFFQTAQSKGIRIDANDLLDDDDDEDDEEEEEEEEEMEPNIPQGAINAFLGYDTGNVGEKLAGNVTLTNDQLYSEVKERVLESAGGFVSFVTGANDDDEENDDDDDDDDSDATSSEMIPSVSKPYVVPTIVPDSELTAGEVVLLVLEALRNNNLPTPNQGVEILFGYSSPGSQIKNEIGLTPAEYADFLKETEYKVLFTHSGTIHIDKADYSFDGKKAFFTARLQASPSQPLDTVSVNFILSTKGREDDACWLIDSLLIRPQSMRRRRRK